VPASQGRQGEGPARRREDPLNPSEEWLEGALIGVFPSQRDVPGDTLERARASRSPAVPAGLLASPVSGTSLAPVRRARWGMERRGEGF
jgi:hypothetical protein